jgi:hypothetical protein
VVSMALYYSFDFTRFVPRIEMLYYIFADTMTPHNTLYPILIYVMYRYSLEKGRAKVA